MTSTSVLLTVNFVLAINSVSYDTPQNRHILQKLYYIVTYNGYAQLPISPYSADRLYSTRLRARSERTVYRAAYGEPLCQLIGDFSVISIWL